MCALTYNMPDLYASTFLGKNLQGIVPISLSDILLKHSRLEPWCGSFQNVSLYGVLERR